MKIIFLNGFDIILVRESFVCLPRLTTLEMYQEDSLRHNQILDGRIWEHLIRSCFPLLKHFRFYFQYSMTNVKEIIESFSTPFYLLEKKWFIRCDFSYLMSQDRKGSPDGYDHKGVCYSLPLTFQPTFIYEDRYYRSISTSTDDLLIIQWKTLILRDNINEHFKQIQTINLRIDAPINRTFPLIKFQHLSLSKNANLSSNIFESLLMNSSDFYSLEIDNNFLDILTEHWTHRSICNQLSNKIRHLKFHSATNPSQCFSKSRLIDILPVFASKCSYLSLSIQSKIELVALILKRMKQLDNLHIHFLDKDHQPITIEWFQQNQTKFHYSNCFLTKKQENYYFWLDKYFS